MGEIAAFAAGVAAAITQLVTALKAVESLKGFQEWVWIVVACAFGVGGMLVVEVDLSALPIRGPDVVARVIVGLMAGFISAGLYEAKQTVRTRRAARAAQTPVKRKARA